MPLPLTVRKNGHGGSPAQFLPYKVKIGSCMSCMHDHGRVSKQSSPIIIICIYKLQVLLRIASSITWLYYIAALKNKPTITDYTILASTLYIQVYRHELNLHLP